MGDADSQASAEIEQSALRERARRTRERWGWAAATTTLAAVAIALAAWPRTSARMPAAAAHFVVETRETLIFQDFDDPALSPDGRYVAFTGLTPAGITQLWLRPLAAPDARSVPATEGAAGGAFWSADSATVFFEASGELRKLTLESGTVQKICPVPGGLLTGGSSSEDGTIVFSGGVEQATLYRGARGRW